MACEPRRLSQGSTASAMMSDFDAPGLAASASDFSLRSAARNSWWRTLARLVGRFIGWPPSEVRQQVVVATRAFVHGVGTRDRVETTQSVHGTLVGGGIGLVVGETERVVALGRGGPGDPFFGEAGMALLLQAALFFRDAGD